MEYQTEEQFLEICDSMYNGQWTQAAKECVEYGFFASDIVQHLEDLPELSMNIHNFIFLIEEATKLRYNK